MEIIQENAIESLKQDLTLLRLKHLEATIPSRLFHYTDSRGLLGILESQKLWVTHAFYLNDSTEVTHTYELVDEIYDELRAQVERNGKPTNINDTQYKHLWFLAGIHYKSLRPKPNPDVYVACFCEKDDLLSQWRGYGHMGSGYAIGFDANQLNHPIYPFKLRRVIYSIEQQKQILRNLLEIVIASFVGITNGRDFDKAEAIIEAHNLIFEEEVVKYAPFFKHPTFREEQEWRLIYSPTENAHSDRIKFSSGNLGIIYYAEIGLKGEENNENGSLLPISSIRIGPTAQPTLARNALKMVAGDKYPDIEVLGSDVPLR